jgi:hypothetical protein
MYVICYCRVEGVMGVKGSVRGQGAYKACFYFLGRKTYLGFYAPKILVMGQSIVSFWEGKKKLWV